MAHIGQVLPQGCLQPPHHATGSAKVMRKAEIDIVSLVGNGKKKAVRFFGAEPNDMVVGCHSDGLRAGLKDIGPFLVHSHRSGEVRKTSKGLFRSDAESFTLNMLRQNHLDPDRINIPFFDLIQRIRVKIIHRFFPLSYGCPEL